jgi:hypothetical protein
MWDMHALVIHNVNGDITGLVTWPSHCPPAGIQIPAGQRMTELDAVEIDCDVNNPSAVRERLAEVIKNFRVDVTSGGARLVKREA